MLHVGVDFRVAVALQYRHPIVLSYFGHNVGSLDPAAELGHLGCRGAGSATDRSVTECVGCRQIRSEEGTF